MNNILFSKEVVLTNKVLGQTFKYLTMTVKDREGSLLTLHLIFPNNN